MAQSLIAMLVDNSGSMGSSLSCYNENLRRNAAATIAGFNTFVRIQQMRADDCQFALAFFDDNLEYHIEPQSNELIHSMAKAPVLYGPWVLDEHGEAVKLSDDDREAHKAAGHRHYSNMGGTQLFSNLVKFTDALFERIKKLPENQRPRNKTFVIQTDGDSMGFPQQARERLEDMRKDGWRIIFLAAGFEAAALGKDKLRITDKETVTYQPGLSAGKVFENMAHDIVEALAVNGRV